MNKPTQTELLEIVATLENHDNTNKADLIKLQKFIEESPFYFRTGGSPENHLCAFFVPIIPSKRLVYVGHHKKANDWIPPGGHMEPGETPLQTVHREFKEELSYTLSDEPIRLFDIAIKDVSSPNRSCKLHYDIWYLVELKEAIPFSFQRKEFYDAAWVTYAEAVQRMKTDVFRKVMQKLRDRG